MKKIWIARDSMVTALGNTTPVNYERVRSGTSGISLIDDRLFSNTSFYGSQVKTETSNTTRFESLCVKAITESLNGITLPAERTLFILSTTKGNIDQLNKNNEVVSLPATAKRLAKKFSFQHSLVVSNACISGVLALITASRFLQSEKFDHAVVVGADVLSKFVVSGFQSLQALSAEPCKPFDASRSGINLGEAAAVMILSTHPERIESDSKIYLAGGGISNDANHISGPSRTGEELATAVRIALQQASVTADEIDFISAHGTATIYNDEMEGKAFSLAGMNHIPVNSLKGYFGHTLGAAGILETVITMKSMMRNETIPTYGFKEKGISSALHICDELKSKPMNTVLKTASGFGGCNAAVVLAKA